MGSLITENHDCAAGRGVACRAATAVQQFSRIHAIVDASPEDNPMPGVIIRAALFGSLALAAHALTGCDSKQAGGAAPPPPPVTVARPLQKQITEWDEYTGRFVAVESVEVRARVSGFIDKVNFSEGQLVKQGDLLFVID